MRGIVISMCVCLSVRVYHNLRVKLGEIFLYMLPVTGSRGSVLC